MDSLTDSPWLRAAFASVLLVGCGDSADETRPSPAEGAALEPVTSPFTAKVNFQPATAAVPSGYLIDSGAIYGDRGNGFTYGWDADASSSTRDRNSSNSPDQRYDTFVYTQTSGTRTWQLAVPNGSYTVHLVAGDATGTTGSYQVNVEGILTVSGKPSRSSRWVEGTRTVQVSDGALTISNASGASNNKLDFVEVTGASAGTGGTGGTTGGTGGTGGTTGGTGGTAGGSAGKGGTGGTTGGTGGTTGGTGGTTGGSAGKGGTGATAGAGATGGSSATGGSGAIGGAGAAGTGGTVVGTTSAGCGKAAPRYGDFHLQTTDGAGHSRDYEVIVPASYSPSTPIAVTFVYHEGGGFQADAKGWGIQNQSGADASIFVFPQGIQYQSYGLGWDDSCSGYDMPFHDRMLAYLSDNYCVAPTRVFAAGFSWGCDHVTALSCCRGSQFRAIAAASCTDEFNNPADYRTYQNSCPTSGTTAVRFTYDPNGDVGYTQQMFQTTVSLFRSFNSCAATSTASGSACVSYDGCTKPFLDCRYPGMNHTRPPDWASATWSFFSSFH